MQEPRQGVDRTGGEEGAAHGRTQTARMMTERGRQRNGDEELRLFLNQPIEASDRQADAKIVSASREAVRRSMRLMADIAEGKK